jgi:5-methylcytosine-specific restriction protein B
MSVTKQGKLRVIERTLGPDGPTLPPDSLPVRALEEWIGHPGVGFNVRRDIQVAYFIDFLQRFKALDVEEARKLLQSPWELRDFADETDAPVREMRHILLHLLHPEEFERISSGSNKREIVASFAGLLPDGAPTDVDEQLLAIRGRLAQLVPGGNVAGGELDFYNAPLHRVWEASAGGEGEGTSDLEALEWKKQLILYGPPGTSKTFDAERLARTLVQRAALLRWGPKAFFENQDAVERLAGGDERRGENIEWVQLHPAYGYEQFVRGMRLEREETIYRKGLLPDIVERRIPGQELPEGLSPLPFVLVLDEINRTDLSAMFGEAFSLLERDKRGKEVELPGLNPGDEAESLVLPRDLFVIGTMNEIDQSVETLDFALRRRFLWRLCPFERDTLLEIVRSRWRGDVPSRFRPDDAVEQLELFADRATALNAAIAASDELGRHFEVGHTYFADITFFLGVWLSTRKQRPARGRYLWAANGTPQPPLADLWSRSLQPLLAQYLAGSDMRDQEVERFRRTLLASP